MSMATRLVAFAQAVAADIKALTSGKVSVVAGKGLSTNDYTTEEKDKLASCVPPGYDRQVTIAAAAGLTNCNLSLGTIFALTLTGNVTISLSNIPALGPGQSYSFVIRLISGATKYTITWPSGLTWLNTNGGVGDTPAAGQIIEYVFSTSDGATALVRKGAST